MKNKQVTFDRRYYNSIMEEFGYDPLEFEKINFSLGKLNREDIQRMWLCHHDGNSFARDFKKGNKVIVSTGFGLSGDPHVGT